MKGSKIYLPKNVLEASQERVAWAFDTFKTIVVSVSGGKDSTVLFDLAYQEVLKRGREINAFFLDQEAEYQSSIEVIENVMYRDGILPYWYQIPSRMTNATSYTDNMLYAWYPEFEADWIHPQVDISIKDPIPQVDRFYKILDYVDRNWGENTCILVGLRADEALNRYRTVTKHPAVSSIGWSSIVSRPKNIIKLYPIYDWGFSDIWIYIGDNGVKYNKVYDWMHMKGYRPTQMRVSNLIHEKAYISLGDIQEFEPETYDRLLKRLKGVHIAARYSREQMMFATKKLPSAYETWKEYRDFLLGTYTGDKLEVFLERFESQKKNERVYRQQVKQLLINDWENNVPVAQMDKKENPLKKWMEIL